ncbi:MAG: phosphoenolpyruvate carboxylase, partial [Bacteroidales bacterium]|nr:phosphoenolpyruvate carboxylase [Bacteroidales bacterium]
MLQQSQAINSFNNWVRKKYNIYNGIFLNLPFEHIGNIGVMIPVMASYFQAGLDKGLDPQALMDGFFKTHTGITEEQEKIDFMFRVIQYVERQIVLYDSVEDAAFPHLQDNANNVSIIDYIHLGEQSPMKSRLIRKLSSFSIRPVFTAHPTQFYPPAVLDIIARLKSMVDNNDLNGIDLTLQQLGMTPMRKSQKPTPFEEAQNIIYYLRHVYYDAIGKCYSRIKENLPYHSFDNPGLMRIGFWPGGDRDGNPYVTAETTRKVADDLRMSLMKCYYGDIKELGQKLTFRDVDARMAALRSNVYKSMFDPAYILSYDELMDSVAEIRKLVLEHHNSLYLEDLDKFIDKLKIFRTHFATLDIRQDHTVHRKAIREILKNEGLIKDDLAELSEDQLLEILLKHKLHLDPEIFNDAVVKETILNIFQLRDIQEKNGEQGCNRYIISNSEDMFSVLFVFALFRWSGYSGQKLTFDIVPLFETMQGMAGGAAIMQDLFNIPQYREHVSRRKNRQTIMLGFSDGTKDGGYLKANWSIFKTKEELSAVCSAHDIDVIFFDGRGGPPARGGGKSHRFYAAQSEKIANHEIQLTIQGQTITSRYGTREQFMHNCDQLLTAGLARELQDDKICIDKEARILIDELAEVSYRKYLELKEHPLFVPYLEHKTPLKYYSEANIGSRPAKRGKKKELEFSDLRAIPFVGSWSQMKQNVPGYFGLGSALDALVKKGKQDALKKLFSDVPFFKALIMNSMMSLTKCNFALTKHMGDDPVYGDFWRIIYDEYRLSVEMVLAISGYDEL